MVWPFFRIWRARGVCFLTMGAMASYPCLASPSGTHHTGRIKSQDVTDRALFERAEKTYGVPPLLLHAIALVESGRPGGSVGASPWPWSVNVKGKSHYFPSKTAAIHATHSFLTQGETNVDVGVMQISLHHHPQAFRSLEHAFDPQANVAYAAQFLARLYKQSGCWHKAAGLYHSATPTHQLPYQRKVLHQWGHLKTHTLCARGLKARVPPSQISGASYTYLTPIARPSPDAPIRRVVFQKGGVPLTHARARRAFDLSNMSQDQEEDGGGPLPSTVTGEVRRVASARVSSQHVEK